MLCDAVPILTIDQTTDFFIVLDDELVHRQTLNLANKTGSYLRSCRSTIDTTREYLHDRAASSGGES